MNIQKFIILKKYLDWVDQVSEDIPDKTSFEPQEIVFKVCDIIDEENLKGTSNYLKQLPKKELSFDIDKAFSSKEEVDYLMDLVREETEFRYKYSEGENNCPYTAKQIEEIKTGCFTDGAKYYKELIEKQK